MITRAWLFRDWEASDESKFRTCKPGTDRDGDGHATARHRRLAPTLSERSGFNGSDSSRCEQQIGPQPGCCSVFVVWPAHLRLLSAISLVGSYSFPTKPGVLSRSAESWFSTVFIHGERFLSLCTEPAY